MSSQNLDANNFMALEPQIVELVKGAVANHNPAVHVLTAADLAGVKEQLQHTPAIHVVHQGFTPGNVRSDGLKAELQHKWLVVAVVSNTHNIRSGATARSDAGALLAQVAAALMGRKLRHASTPLLPTKSPPAWNTAGFYYIPMAFDVHTFFSANLT